MQAGPPSEQFAKTLGVQFDLPQDFAKKWPGEIPAGMIRQRCRASVGVAVEYMAAFLAGSFETQAEEQRVHFPETEDR